MKVSIFKPSGDLITRLEVSGAGELSEHLQELIASGKRIPLRSRVEAEGRCWVISGFNPVQLRENERPSVTPQAPVIETEWRRHDSRRRSGSRRSQMIIGLCWCLGGIAITLGSYLTAANGAGGTYIVAWGAIVFGGFRFLKGLAGSRDHR